MGCSRTVRRLLLVFVLWSQLDVGTAGKSQLKVAICPDNPPYAMRDSVSLPFRGFDVAVWNSVYRNLVQITVNATQAGLADLVGSEPPDLIPQEVEEMLASLKSGDLHIGICNLFVSSERILDGIDFTPAYVASSFTAVVTNEHESWLPISRVLRRFSFTSFPPWAHFSFALVIIAAVCFGHIVWLLERHKNPQFALSYGKGVIDGFWYSIVSATTVGYGDKVTITLGGKIASIGWLLVGTFLAALFYAAVTVNLLDQTNMEPYSGFKVERVPEDLREHRVATDIPQLQALMARQALPVRLYATRAALFSALLANHVDVALAQAETVSYLNAADDVLGGRLIRIGPPVGTMDAAMAVGRVGGERAALLGPLTKAVMVYLTQQWEERQAHLSEWFDLVEASGREAEARVFEAQMARLNVLGVSVLATLLLGWAVVLALERRAKWRTTQSVTCFRRLLQLSTKFSRERLRVGAEALFLRLDADSKGWVGLADLQRVVAQTTSLGAGRLLGPSAAALNDDVRALVVRTARMINELEEGEEGEKLQLSPQSFALLCRTILMHEDEQAVAGASLSLHANKKDLIRSTDALVASLQGTQEHIEELFTHVHDMQRSRQRLEAVVQKANPSRSPSTVSSSDGTKRRRSANGLRKERRRASSSGRGDVAEAGGVATPQSQTRDLLSPPSPLQALERKSSGEAVFSSRVSSSSIEREFSQRAARGGDTVRAGEESADSTYWV